MNIKRILLWFVSVVIFTVLFKTITNGVNNPEAVSNRETVSYTRFINYLYDYKIESVEIVDKNISFLTKNGAGYNTYNPNDPHLIDDLIKYEVEIKSKPPESRINLFDIFISWFPMLLLIGVWIWFMRSMSGRGGGNNQMGLGKSKARMLEEDSVKVRFKDVAGCEEAKRDVAELVDFLKNPQKYHKIGGKIPTGILMLGPPGTGKTLLARAIAGEAGVPFFTISGSDFVEMFVGVGASRVRDMFEQAKKHAPCIIFIDEIDAVGRQRGAGMGGGHDEREQTLNQLLVEMDGFEKDTGVIVMAATNRADILDKALLRPGRFDRQVNVGLPDLKGREAILDVHIKTINADEENINLKYVAQKTPGFSGADLANLVNEAALRAVRNNRVMAEMIDFEKSTDKILMGDERPSLTMTDDEKLLTAYHEAGHCVVGQNCPGHDPVYKVSIMPRNMALGITMFLPERDAVSKNKEKLNSEISALYGGRIAEEIFFGEDKVTTGASNDIERATQTAKNMVTKWGLSDNLRAVDYAHEDGGDPFVGRQMGTEPKSSFISEELTLEIANEIHHIIDKNYERAHTIIDNNREEMHVMSKALMKYETIDKNQIEEILDGVSFEDLSPPDGWEDIQINGVSSSTG